MSKSVLSFAPASLLAATAIAVPVAAQDRIEEVIVTGTYIRRPSQFDSPSPLVNVTSDDLAAAGANDVGRVLEDLTINTGSQNNPDAFTQNFTTGTSNINLRGLGVSSTLVLINGRRQTQSAVTTDRGENFVDTSSLPPMIAFERIEILKDGATALYGSEAVAGVATSSRAAISSASISSSACRATTSIRSKTRRSAASGASAKAPRTCSSRSVTSIASR
jgi:iron complex outermembrane receptor protein